MSTAVYPPSGGVTESFAPRVSPDGRQVAFELHVDDGAHDLGDATDLVGCCSHVTVSFDPNFVPGQTASAPEMISMSSLVIWA